MQTEITDIWIEREHTAGPMIGGKKSTDDEH